MKEHRATAGRPMVIFAGILFLQVIGLLLWETVGRNLLLHALAANTDALDRDYYGSVAHGMRGAMLFVLAVSLAGVVPWVRNRLRLLLVSPSLFPAILAISAVVQMCFVIFLDTPTFSDAAFYVEHATRLFETAAYADADGNPTAFWPVGYPALLAAAMSLSGDMFIFGRLLNVSANIALIFVTYRIFSPLLSDRGRGLFLLIIGLHPLVLFSSVVLMTESIFLLLLWTVVWVLLRMPATWRQAAIMGLLFAAAVYLKPAALFYAVAVALYLGWKCARVRHAAVMLLVIAAMIAPWTARNWLTFGRFVPVATNGGFNILMGNHCQSNGGLNYDFDYNPHGLDEAAASAQGIRRAVVEVASCPLHALSLLPKKLLHAYRRSDAAIIWAMKPVHDRVPDILSALALYLANGLHFFMLPFAFIGFIRIRSAIPKTASRHVILLMLAVTLGVVLLFFGSDRFVLPLLPVHVYLFSWFLTDPGVHPSH